MTTPLYLEIVSHSPYWESIPYHQYPPGNVCSAQFTADMLIHIHTPWLASLLHKLMSWPTRAVIIDGVPRDVAIYEALEWKEKILDAMLTLASTLWSSCVPLTDVVAVPAVWVKSIVQSSEALAELDASLLREHRLFIWIFLCNVSSFGPLTPPCIDMQSICRLATDELSLDFGGFGISGVRCGGLSESASEEIEISMVRVSDSSNCITMLTFFMHQLFWG